MTEIIDVYESKKGKRISDISLETTLIYERLGKLTIGEFISYKEISEIIGQNIQLNRGYLLSARRKLVSEKQIVLGVIRDEGLKRLNNKEIILTGDSAIKHIKRTSVKGMKKMLCVLVNNGLNNDDRIKFHTNISLIGMLHHATTPKYINKIEAKVKEIDSKLTFMKTLKAFEEDRGTV